MGEKITYRPNIEERHLKVYTEGTHRGSSPEDTLAQVEKFFPIFGITRVANVTGLDVIGIPVVIAVRPNSRSLSVSQGKGTSLPAAKISAVMESIEAYHAESLDISTRFLCLEDIIIHHKAVDIERLSLNSEKPFHPAIKIPWVAGYDLVSQGEIWVPYEIVHSDYTYPLPFDSGYFIADSNGLASGNCLVEAINHGICEVIERDALTLWSLKDRCSRNQVRIDLNSVDDPKCAFLVSAFLDKNINVAVWDITSDVNVPAYVCKIAGSNDAQSGIRPAMGAGCHPCKAVALSRALTEAAQSRLTFISGARDDQSHISYDRYQSRNVQEYWIRELQQIGHILDFRERQDFFGKTLEDDLEWLLRRLTLADFNQVVFLDLTKLEFAIPVVKVVIPGMECHTAPEKRIMGSRARKMVSQRIEKELR